MSRNRAPVDGGYIPKTVSLPSSLVSQIDKHLSKNPGMTMSHFVTVAVEAKLKPNRGKR